MSRILHKIKRQCIYKWKLACSQMTWKIRIT